MKKVGIIGAGQMGSGIAHVMAQYGFDVVLFDRTQEILDKALQGIADNMQRQVTKEKMTADARSDALKRFQLSVTYKDFSACDVVIEAATERENLKKEIFTSLIPHLAPHAYLATNTSSISITRLAAVTDRPERFMGLHFMNPVPVMTLIELIRGLATSDETFTFFMDLVKKLERTPAVSNDYPGFIVNRVLMPMINEAIYALFEGVANVESIDQAMKLGTNQPMGPLALADFIGLDTCLAIMNVLHEGLGDKYRPCPLLINYVQAGWLGRKVGRGFYIYDKK